MTKWDELVEVAARASCEIAAKSGAEISHRAWEDAPEHDRQTVREVTGYVMRALLAKGCVIISPNGDDWWDQFARIAFRHLPHGQFTADLVRALRCYGTQALSAGSIKPEGE